MKPTKRINSLILVSVLCLSLAVLFAACRKAPEEIPETSVTETTKRKKPKRKSLLDRKYPPKRRNPW